MATSPLRRAFARGQRSLRRPLRRWVAVLLLCLVGLYPGARPEAVTQPTAETLAVAEETRKALDEPRRSLPAGLELTLMYDQGTLVTHALDGVTWALLLGGVSVALVLVALLGNLRGALMIIAVGLLVDAAGITRRRSGRPR